MKQRIRKIVLLVAVLILVLGAVYLIKGRQGDQAGLLELYGNVDIRQVQLAFHDTGRIQTILVREGDRVKAGQLVAEMDDSRYRANLGRAQGEVEAKRQVLARLEAGSRAQEIAQARARVKAREAELHDAELTFRRLAALREGQYVSQQKLDDAKTVLETAKENLKEAREALDLAIAGPRKEEIKAAMADLAAKEAALAYAKQELADTKLYAPAGGIVEDRLMEPGDMAFPSTPVLTIAIDNPLWVRAYVPETQLGRIVPGMRAEIRTDSFPGKSYPGWVGFISPTAEFTPKNVETAELRTRLVYQVRIYACDSKNELRLGMPATVAIRLDQPTPEGGASGSAVCGEQ